MADFFEITDAIVTYSVTDAPRVRSDDRPDDLSYQLTVFVPPEQAAVIDDHLKNTILKYDSDMQRELNFSVRGNLRVDNAATKKPIANLPGDWRRVRIYSKFPFSIVDKNGQILPDGYAVPLDSRMRLALSFFKWEHKPTKKHGLSYELHGAQILEAGNRHIGKSQSNPFAAQAGNPFAASNQTANAPQFGSEQKEQKVASSFDW